MLVFVFQMWRIDSVDRTRIMPIEAPVLYNRLRSGHKTAQDA